MLNQNTNAEELINVGCKLFNLSGKIIKEEQGQMCIYFDDGKSVHVYRDKMQMIDKEQNIVWEQSGAFHHQVKISDDKKYILALSAKTHLFFGCNARFDTILKIDTESGKVLGEFDLYKNFKDFYVTEKPQSVLKRGVYQKETIGTNCETTHVNSLFELNTDDALKLFKTKNKGWLVNIQNLNVITYVDENLNHLRTIELKINAFEDKITELKTLRKNKSAACQNKIFDQYTFLNARKEYQSLNQLLQERLKITPPAGAGECAAPKLLHFAYANDLKPICMAEFWWGASPASEIRKHKQFYPACKGKCEPILAHMLEGLEVDENPMLINPAENKLLPII